MNFHISLEQEEEINQWIDEENKIAIENQLNSEDFDEETKQKLRESVESGLEIPLHSLEHGYYSISFTPTGLGNRIYVHHHINGSSAKVQDYDDLREEYDAESEIIKIEESSETAISISDITANPDEVQQIDLSTYFVNQENVNS